MRAMVLNCSLVQLFVGRGAIFVLGYGVWHTHVRVISMLCLVSRGFQPMEANPPRLHPWGVLRQDPSAQPWWRVVLCFHR